MRGNGSLPPECWTEMTRPDKPRSSKQRYRLTELGRTWLKGRGMEDGDPPLTEQGNGQNQILQVAVQGALPARLVRLEYPHREPAEILGDLARQTPGEEGKWFAAAKDAGLFEEAIALANRSPCSPQTLSRAARDFSSKNPLFAIEAGMTALCWLVEGYGYDITSVDVVDAYSWTLDAATVAGKEEETRQRIHDLVTSEVFGESFVTRVLGRRLGLS